MDAKIISNWVRQARFRAKRHDIYSNISMSDVLVMIEEYAQKCAYCRTNDAVSLDHPFPLKDNAPNVASNVVTCCHGCKEKKKNNDLLWMYGNGHITEDSYLALLTDLFRRTHGDLIKEHVKKISGNSQ
jgi:hypothetical protein